ncbi:hypothetical protein [Moorena sp. SIO3I6]|uniref:hypothetical protein n=1 Tax=Moorena sp. SIO3I6 TaxID=2607831 RepID=UPI0013FAD9A7|nr:hypothetical protein [Moorena sp. SIO3I6]NEP25515.1 hypothetical protein [Moorena sp. SIO3I6]
MRLTCLSRYAIAKHPTPDTELHSKIVDWWDGEMGRWGDWEIGAIESCTFDRYLVS